ncbi:hypothetical protein PVA45_08515 (plasmid) [Entomospira entomophila]|uniref:Uncharacterized protein n=1 Tax=Entomospira entomophila TaxID=2719988 RepID=A0A968GDC3_9SPIO|nr:hypothetical protein [Entomospira entomophilus]NIZ41498.1 hypothetical protein [Entomospira entomophilus]WDI36418.1 hypothetical protein PVA45_08515 [Entomospira entomophilus]
MHGRVLAEDNIDGRFADNDLRTGTRGTRIEAREQNDVYFEVANAIAEARIAFDGSDETQLSQAIIAIARREGALNGIEIEMHQSPQSFRLADFGIPSGAYLATLSLQGDNPNDITLSYRLQEDSITLYAWYTNAQGKRVQGVPNQRSEGGFGKFFDLPWDGKRAGARTKVSIFLKAR